MYIFTICKANFLIKNNPIRCRNYQCEPVKSNDKFCTFALICISSSYTNFINLVLLPHSARLPIFSNNVAYVKMLLTFCNLDVPFWMRLVKPLSILVPYDDSMLTFCGSINWYIFYLKLCTILGSLVRRKCRL